MKGATIQVEALVDGQLWTHGSPFDDVFDSVAEAAEEAELNPQCVADTVVGRDGKTLHGVPVDEVLSLLGR